MCPGTGHTPPDSMPGAQGVHLTSQFIQIPVECLLCARHRARYLGCPESRPGVRASCRLVGAGCALCLACACCSSCNHPVGQRSLSFLNARTG